MMYNRVSDRFGLGRLRHNYSLLRNELERIQNDQGPEPRPDNRRENVGGGGGGGGGQTALLDELKEVNLDQRAVDKIRGEIFDNRSRRANQSIDSVQTEKKRLGAEGSEKQLKLEELQLARMAIENEQLDIKLEDEEKEVYTAGIQRDNLKAMRRN